MEGNGALQIKGGSFLILSLLYFIASFFGFVFTSSGWTGFLIYGIGGLIFFVANYLFLCLLIINKRPSWVKIPIKWFMILVVIQIIASLFNIGGYGDNTGSRSFFEVILGRSYFSCHGNDCSRPPLLGGLAGLLALIGVASYLICLMNIQFKIFRSALDQAHENKSVYKTNGPRVIDFWSGQLILIGFIYGINYFIRYQFHALIYISIACLFVIVGVGILLRKNWSRMLLILLLSFLLLRAIVTLLRFGYYSFYSFRWTITGTMFELLLLILVSIWGIVYFTKQRVKDSFH